MNKYFVWMHYAIAALIGLPAAGLGLFLAWTAMHFTPTREVPKTTSNDGMEQLFNSLERGMAAVITPLNALGEWLTYVLLAVCIVVVLMATVVFLVGRGLSRRAKWSPAVAGVLWGGLCLLGVGELMIGSQVQGVLLATLGGYGIWAVSQGFA